MEKTREEIAIKTDGEIALMKKAQSITDGTFTYILTVIKAGMTEIELKDLLEAKLYELGADGLAFPSIIAFGESAVDPHAVPSERMLRAGDFVLMDFGAAYQGYNSDMTRTVAYGFVTKEQKKIYNSVLKAQVKTEKLLKAGLTCEDVHNYCLGVLGKCGYGGYMPHGTGHGVGKEIHEFPFLSSAARNMTENDKITAYTGTKLQAGEVVTVEPGIYLPGRIGVRIEDMGKITETGFEVFTKSPKSLIIVA